MEAYLIDGRMNYRVGWVCGGYASDALIIADPEPLGGVCERCEAVGWCVYRCFSADGQLLWIGSTVNLRQRILTHQSRSPWWGNVADVKKSPQPDELTARLVEAQAIRAEKPLRNKEHNRDRIAEAAA